MRKTLLFIGLTLSLMACAALSAPMAGPASTPTPSPSKTSKPTLTPTLSPSTTPQSTETPAEFLSPTPEPVLSATPTAIPPSPPPTPTPLSALDCKLLWQSPGNGIVYEPNEAFTIGWRVRNTGTAAWNTNSVEFTYVGGSRLYDYPLVQLKTSVAPGQDVVLSVHMRAPRNSTTYKTYWSLRQGDTYFCHLMLWIYVD